MSTFTKDIPAISQSHQLQQWLKQNPDKAERAIRYRESVVMEFLRAQKLSPTFDPNVYQAISNGYNPNKVPIASEAVQEVVPIPVAIPLVCTFNPPYLQSQHSVGPGNGEIPTEFNFTPGSGNSVYIRLDPLDPGDVPASEIIMSFTGISDSAIVYIKQAGAPEFSTDPNDYTEIEPEAQPFGPYDLFMNGGDIYPYMFYYDQELDDYLPRVPQVIDFVVYHRGIADSLLFSINIQCSGA